MEGSIPSGGLDSYDEAGARLQGTRPRTKTPVLLRLSVSLTANPVAAQCLSHLLSPRSSVRTTYPGVCWNALE